jgi:hypothetical protein
MEMGGHRPQSPASADNAPSPSKRPRLEGSVNGQQLAPNGRGQGQVIPGQPNHQMMMQNGMQGRMSQAQYQQQFQQSGPAQQKNMQVYAQNLALHHSRSASNSQGIPNGGMMNPGIMANQADLVQMPEGQGMYPMPGGPDYYTGANGQMNQVRPNGMQTPGPPQGNHALQDYQMQLMLLEQQNKRRLMMARQEQDTMARSDGQPPMPGQGGLPPGTSPGSRAGASPNPSDQMKRGTPKMNQTGLPGSPSAGDMSQRGSPGSMNLNGGQMPPDMAGQFFPGPNMRPPSSNPAFTGAQVGQPISANAGQRMPNGQWQPGQQQMAPQHSPANQTQAGTPQERSAMPPPSAPPVTGPNVGRGAPASPQTAGNAPPTPNQTNKPAPKGKKDPKDTRKVCIPLLLLLSLMFTNFALSDLPRSKPLPPLQVPLPPPRPQSPQLHRLPSHLTLPLAPSRTESMELTGLYKPSPSHQLPRTWSRLLTRTSNPLLTSASLMYVNPDVLY